MAEDAAYPKVILCRGGWFAVWREGDIGSGPWHTEESAKQALAHNYDEANRIHAATAKRQHSPASPTVAALFYGSPR